jgi:hypothetical protein
VTPSFVGRRTELALLGKRLDAVAASGTGIAVAIRGRRQVGKSRLVQDNAQGRPGRPWAIAAPPRRATIRTSLVNWGTDSPVNTGTHSGLFTLITCSIA